MTAWEKLLQDSNVQCDADVAAAVMMVGLGIVAVVACAIAGLVMNWIAASGATG